MSAIETRDLTRVFGDDIVAIDNLNLSVDTGEAYGFLGPNGAGKSTTINLLLGFLRPTSGSVSVLGMDVADESLSIRDRIGILPEVVTPYERLTGYEHLEFAIRCKDADDDADAIRSRVGLSEANADRPAGEYSKGMAQRLALGMALIGDPELLILDEPSTGLDPSGMAGLRDIVRDETASGTAVFFSSHLLGEVEAVCDRVGILTDGRLVADDDIDSLRDRFDADCSITVHLDQPPTDGVDLSDIDGVLDWSVEADEITVVCRTADAKAPVVTYFDERAAVRNVHSAEPSLSTLFEDYAAGADGPGTGEAGAEAIGADAATTEGRR